MRTRLFFSLLVLVGLATSALAQRDLGTITGTVLDPAGAVVVGAKVSIINAATGLTVAVESDSTGNYVRPALPPGTYSIEVEMAGFKKAIQRNVSVGAGDRVGVNMTLEVGEVTQSVEVSAAPAALQTESTIVGATLQARNMTELPLGGQRKFTFLARLSPAVVPAEPGARDAAGGAFSANGVRSNGQNNFLLNGVDNNVNVIDFINQTAYVIGPSVEAIGEMKIMTSGYNAEYGRGAGGVINVTIKSGTNDFHGVLFEMLQNDKLNANTWEGNRAGKNRGPFKQNQFGAAVGGKIIRDKLFWFVDYQGTRIRSTGGTVPGLGNTYTRTIPFPEMKNGDFSRLLRANWTIWDPLSTTTADGRTVRTAFPGNIIPQSRFDSAARQIISEYPNPNQNLNDAIPNNNFLAVTSGRQQNDQGDVRIDYRLSEKDTLFGSLSWSEETKFNEAPFPGALDGTGFAGQDEKNQSRNAMLSWTRVWSPTFLTETRLAFTRLITARTQANANENLFQKYGIKGYNPTTTLNGGLPFIEPQGVYSAVGGSEWLPTQEYSNVWDFIQNVAINKRGHAIKFGYEYRPIGFPFFQVPSPRGTFRFNPNRTQDPQNPATSGDGIAGWLLGYPSDSRITTTNFISSDKVAHAWYIQDDWRIAPRLTINLGMRYELFSPIGESLGRQSNFEYMRATPTLVIPKGKDQNAPLPPNFPASIAVERGQASKYMIPWDKTNWGPRVGLAWEARKGFVVRAGYGMFYGGEENQGGDPNRGESVPFNQESQFNLPNAFAMNPFLTRFTDGWPTNAFSLPAPLRYRLVAPNWRNPLVQKWNFSLQKEIGWNMVWEVSYIGSRGSRLVLNWNPNQPVNDPNPAAPVAPRRLYNAWVGNTAITETAAFGKSGYHALASKLEKRFSNGLDFLMSYTWGHALTNVGTTLAGGPGLRDIVRGFDIENSHANFDIRHRFVFSGMYELPFGRGKQFGANWNKAADLFLGNWQMNGILTLQTGNAFNLGTSQASCGCGGTVRPDLVAGKNPNNAPPGGRTPDLWFDTSAVMRPAPGTFGNLGHYAVFGPGTRNIDLSLFKDFRITERYLFQFRAESFNLSNTPQFNVQQIAATQGQTGFGRINGTNVGTQRSYQLALRFRF